MNRYVALLRGVNVGGINLKMADVAAAFSDLDVQNVKTVLASGNVLFDSVDTAEKTKPRIEAALRAAFGYEAWVHILDLPSLGQIVADFPFNAEREGWHPYVIFVAGDENATELAQNLVALQPELDPALESVAGGDGVVYWTVERGHTLDSVIGKATSRARYKSMTTTRNLRTLQKLLR
ncbi:MAG: DUF1697 domain-containing protein [Microbacteriaceae bacterium]